MEAKNIQITSHSVGKLSTYELRQELLRRNALDIEEPMINHKTMLQRLMVELVKEERADQTRIVEAQEKKLIHEREEAKCVRERKKEEALQRSKERQANPEYFAKLAESNKLPVKDDIPTKASSELADDDDALDTTETNEEDEDFDPFKQKKSKNSRFKIFVRP